MDAPDNLKYTFYMPIASSIPSRGCIYVYINVTLLQKVISVTKPLLSITLCCKAQEANAILLLIGQYAVTCWLKPAL